MYTQQFGGEILAVIPQRTAIKEAARLATPIEFFAGAPPDARRSYRDIAARVLTQLGVPRRARPAATPLRERVPTAPRATPPVVPHNAPAPRRRDGRKQGGARRG